MLSLSFKNPFPNLDLSDPACRLDDSVTVAIARLHLGLQPTSQIALDRNAVCACGFRLSNDTHHFTGCSLLNRQQVLCHDGGYKAVVQSLEACGIHTRTEHQLKGTQQRVDVSYTHPLTGQRVHIDFTIVNPAAMSTAHSVILPNMTAMRPLFSREASKRSKHEAYARAEGYDFFPWVVDPYGATTFTARKLVQSALTAASLTRSHTAPERQSSSSTASQRQSFAARPRSSPKGCNVQRRTTPNRNLPPRGEGLILPVSLFVLLFNLFPLCIVYEKSSSDIYHERHDSDESFMSISVYLRLIL